MLIFFSAASPCVPYMQYRIALFTISALTLSATIAFAQTSPKATRPGAEGIASSDTSASARIIREVKIINLR
ncbi:MAG: hypothetical protein JWM95_2184 [Gemmatimonadetes bacterium]|nr:hypothetical protein [Gemmatimonadota bacterium]